MQRTQPSDWITRWAHLAPAKAAVLDLACGSGRHFRWWAALGHQVTGVDRDLRALAADVAAGRVSGELICADLEAGPWPLAGRQFDVVMVTNYLWRPLWPALLRALAPGGLLLYETFAIAQASVGRPSNPDFLLQPGELLSRCAGLRVLGYEDGALGQPLRFVQRIAAIQPSPSSPMPRAYTLPEAPMARG